MADAPLASDHGERRVKGYGFGSPPPATFAIEGVLGPAGRRHSVCGLSWSAHQTSGAAGVSIGPVQLFNAELHRFDIDALVIDPRTESARATRRFYGRSGEIRA